MQAALDFQEDLSEKKETSLILMPIITQASEGISGRLADLRKKEDATENEAWTILDNRFDDPGHTDAARSKPNSLKQGGEAYEAYVQDFSNRSPPSPIPAIPIVRREQREIPNLEAALEDMIPALQIALVDEANEGVGRDLEKLETKEGATTKEVWEILDKRFEDPFHRARASERLESLRQRGRPLDEYIAEYGDVLQQAGGEDYHEDVKIRGLMRGLDDELYDRMITTPTCKKLVDQIESLRRVSQRLEEAQRRKHNKNHTTFFSRPAEVQRGDPMDIDVNTTRVGNRPTQGPGPGLPTDDAYRGKVSKWVSKEELQARKDADSEPQTPTPSEMDVDDSPVVNPGPPRFQSFPQFHGKKGLYRIWKRQMTAMLQLQQYTDVARVVAAMQVALMGEANESVGGEIERLGETSGTTVKDVWKVLDDRFDDPLFKARASERLENVQQGNRTLERYIAEYRDLLQQAGGEKYPEDVKIRGLMRGLDDALYEQMITIPTCLTLEKQIESLRRVALRMEELAQRKIRNRKLILFTRPAEIQEGDPMDIDINTTRVQAKPQRPVQGSGPGLPTDVTV
ncbi:Retrotransposon gag protein [Ceratocystis lukuohia]|uniref:Retrotransposon gag protein n=1 Tax=Ceratocystis lukuohia TaxID=2019550 RepID=A0ABR4M8K6_9PEZI